MHMNPHRYEKPSRYGMVAIILHWLIATGILILIGMGLVMDHVTLDPMRMFQLYQLHKSIGITILMLVCLRLGWRLTHGAPPLPDSLSVQARRMAHMTHRLLYGLQIFLPLSGWALVSASALGIPTVLFGGILWPDIPVLSTLQNKAPVEAVLKDVHHWAAWILGTLIVLHVVAVLHHTLFLKDTVLEGMLPWPTRPLRRKRSGDFS